MKINMEKILCPLDFSKCSDHALTYAIAMAQTFEAQLILLHVVMPPMSSLPGDPLLPEISRNAEEIEDACGKRLEEAEGPIRDLGIDVQTTVVNGTPFAEIVRVAREEEVSFIVMGTHGRSGWQHLLIGSVAERVVRKAACPVLTVKHPEHEFVMP